MFHKRVWFSFCGVLWVNGSDIFKYLQGQGHPVTVLLCDSKFLYDNGKMVSNSASTQAIGSSLPLSRPRFLHQECGHLLFGLLLFKLTLAKVIILPFLCPHWTLDTTQSFYSLLCLKCTVPSLPSPLGCELLHKKDYVLLMFVSLTPWI